VGSHSAWKHVRSIAECAGWCIVAFESTFSAMRTLTSIGISPGHSNFASYLEQFESHVLLNQSSNPPASH
jgi:hypothetical protein